MNQPPKPKISIIASPEWKEIIRLASQMDVGQIVIRIQDNKVILSEYTVKRKPDATDEFTVFPL